jgi:PI-3-kinase-related kinase SMG-1
MTFEFGAMLEEILGITNDMHDVHLLEKKNVTLHWFLMENLSRANLILLPLESLLLEDVTIIKDSKKKAKKKVSPIHGQTTY